MIPFSYCFFIWFSNLQTRSGHVFGHWAFFLRLSLSSPTWCSLDAAQELFQEVSTLTRQLFQPSPPVLFLKSQLCFQSPYVFSSPLLSSISGGHWGLRPVRDTGRQRTINIQQMAGAPLNLPVTLAGQTQRPSATTGLHFTPTVTPINQIPHFIIL